MKFLIIQFTFCSILGMHIAQAEAWVRGAATVLEASGGVKIDISASGTTYESFDQPIYFPGIFSSDAEPGGSVLIHTSNGINLLFQGEGVFSVERFEGLFGNDPDGGGELVEAQSRMILNLRRGELLIDSRTLTGDSRFIVETPFGRISSVKAVLQIQIEYDYRSSIYDFTISCAEGNVRLRDLRKEVYSIYAGQRISGAGSFSAPAIEVAAQTDEIREKFERFFETLDGLDLEKIDRVKLRARMQGLAEGVDVTASNFSNPQEKSPEDARWPRIIEYAPQAEAITPFRGEVRPPSDYQADIF